MRRGEVRSYRITKNGRYRSLATPPVHRRRGARIAPAVRFREKCATETRNEEYQRS